MSRVAGKQADPAKSKTPAKTASVEPIVEEPPSPSPVPEDVPPAAPANAEAEGSAQTQPDEKVTCFRCSCSVHTGKTPSREAMVAGTPAGLVTQRPPCCLGAALLSMPNSIRETARISSKEPKPREARARAASSTFS